MTVPDLDYGDTITEAFTDAITTQLNDLPLFIQHAIESGLTSDANGDIEITFPTAFGAAPTVFITRVGSTTTLFDTMLSAVSATSFKARMFNGTARQTNTGGNGFHWVAIGTPA